MRYGLKALAAALLAFLPAGAFAQGWNAAYGPVVTASSGGVDAGVTTATLAAPTGGASWFVTGLEITGATATASSNVPCTVTGLQGGTMTLTQTVALVPATTAGPVPPVVIAFAMPLSGAPATAIVFSCPSFGSGNLKAAIAIHGVLIR